MEVDLVMWTRNGAETLPKVLRRIDEVVPKEVVCHKILVDDHSVDDTTEIAKEFNWQVYPNPKTGISSGANEALRHIDTELEEIWKDNQKTYRCKNKDLHHDFCEHVLKATKKDMGNFSCENCDSPLDECNCFDCFAVFCDQCNSFISLSCSDVVQMMEINEEK
jgi:glycosyltransferase involved in cell wall biosynthesis